MSKPVVAIVGRPNVGKSSLFNTLYGERISIVHDTPGVTRDRIYADAEWRGRQFIMIDTGGIEPGDNEDYILKQMRVQAEIAIETADVILFITDLHAGLTAADEEIAVMLRKAGRPVVVAVNKVDTVGDPPAEFYEFYQLGLENVCSISAAHRLGLGEMLDMIFEQFPDTEDEEEEEGSIRVALIGRPNAGKSSLANKMIGQDRSIVSDIAGTTRDTIDSDIENDYGKFTIVDTAGMRKKGKIEDVIERYSMVRALSAIERAIRIRHQQVGPHRERDRHDGGHGEDSQGQVRLHGLCSGNLHLGQDRPARRQALQAHSYSERECEQAPYHGHIEPDDKSGGNARAHASGQGQASQDLLRHAGQRQAAYVRALRKRQEAVALLL